MTLVSFGPGLSEEAILAFPLASLALIGKYSDAFAVRHLPEGCQDFTCGANVMTNETTLDFRLFSMRRSAAEAVVADVATCML